MKPMQQRAFFQPHTQIHIPFSPDRILSFPEAIEEYLSYSRSIGSLSETTVYNRQIELNRFSQFCNQLGAEFVTDLKKQTVISYLGGLRVAAGTKKTIMNILSAFFDYLIEEHLILDNFLGSIKKPKTFLIEGDYLSLDEINHLFYSTAQSSNPKHVDRNLLLLSLFTVLCLRVAETINLKMSDVHLNEKMIWIVRKGGKIAKIPLNDDLVDKFENWYYVRSEFKGHQKPWVFISTHGKQMTIRQARNIVTGALETAGIDKRKKGPHLLRHSGATVYLQQGENIKTIQYLLGHSNLTTTSRYVHSDRATLENSINNCPIFGNN